MRIVIAVVALVIAVAACDRVVELYPRPDASTHLPDAHPDPLPDAATGSDGSTILPDAAIQFDASFPD